MVIHPLLFLVILLSLTFTYTNGFQDGSTVTASAIGSRALGKVQAILLVSIFEFCGALFGGSAVANTIQALTNFPLTPTLLPVLVSGLVSAIVWNFITRSLKIPSSSTHALAGGILGAIYAAGHGPKYFVSGIPDHIIHSTGIWKLFFSLTVSPIIGFLAGFIIYKAMILIFLLGRASTRVNQPLKSLQLITTAAIAFGHGAIDTQKAMGLIVLALAAASSSPTADIPIWVRILTGCAMVCGIISLAPGIVKNVGRGIYRLRPIHGFVTQSASGLVLLMNSLLGGPVATSQVISSSIMGIGTAERRKGVHWLVARDILVSWAFTVPLAGLLALTIYNSFGPLLERLH